LKIRCGVNTSADSKSTKKTCQAELVPPLAPKTQKTVQRSTFKTTDKPCRNRIDLAELPEHIKAAIEDLLSFSHHHYTQAEQEEPGGFGLFAAKSGPFL